MSEELQKPPVIDLEALLQPISEENPAGEYLRYSGIYDQIAEARRADENLHAVKEIGKGHGEDLHSGDQQGVGPSARILTRASPS